MVMNTSSLDSYIINDKWSYNSVNQIIVRSTGRVITLRAKTADVLNLLIASNQTIVTSERFINSIWDGRYVSENVLKQSISEIRAAFDDGGKEIVRTAPKKGYWLTADINRLSVPLEVNDAAKNSSDSDVVNSDVVNSGGKRLALMTLSAAIGRRKGTQVRIDEKAKSRRVQRGLEKNTQVASPRHGDSPRSAFRIWYVVAIAFVFILIVMFLFQNVSLKKHNNWQKVRLEELTSYMETTQKLMSRYYNAPDHTPDTLLEMLNKQLDIELSSTASLAEQKGRLDALYQFHQIGGYYKESRILLGNILENTEIIYGKHSTESLTVKFETVQTLINLHQRQDAYDLSRQSLQLAIQYHEGNQNFMANAYFVSAQAFLYCTEPFCKRQKILANGEEYARVALDLFEDAYGSSSIQVADTLSLLNWFVWEPNEKISLMQSAVDIYSRKLGFYHEKTASGLEQLGRSYAFFFQEWVIAEKHLLEALAIREKLYLDSHPSMLIIHGYLAEHYFMVGQFSKSSHYLERYYAIALPSRGEGNDGFLEKLMLQARSELYAGDISRAKLSIENAFEIIDRHKMTPAGIVYQALVTTRERVHSELSRVPPDYSQLMSSIENAKQAYKAPSAVVKHEYYTQILKYYPNRLGADYLENLKMLVQSLKPSSRYLYFQDLLYLKRRAYRLCPAVGARLCEDIHTVFLSVLPE